MNDYGLPQHLDGLHNGKISTSKRRRQFLSIVHYCRRLLTSIISCQGFPFHQEYVLRDILDSEKNKQGTLILQIKITSWPWPLSASLSSSCVPKSNCIGIDNNSSIEVHRRHFSLLFLMILLQHCKHRGGGRFSQKNLPSSTAVWIKLSGLWRILIPSHCPFGSLGIQSGSTFHNWFGKYAPDLFCLNIYS